MNRRAPRWSDVIVGAAVLAAAWTYGCVDVPRYACVSNGNCRIDGEQGTCRTSTGTCVYPDIGCPSGLRYGDGRCAPPGTETTTASSSSSTTAGTSTSADSVDSGDGSSGPSDTTNTTGGTGPTEICGGPLDNLTGLGVVGASTVYQDFNPPLSVDNDLSTSWFSTGPEGGGIPSQYTWTVVEPRCIGRLFIAGNAGHETPEFRTGYGFEMVTFVVYDENDQPVFQETRSLMGTPDPEQMVETEGVIGKRVVLELYDHESDECGGFAELQVWGR